VDIIYKNLFINLKNKYSDGALAEAFLTRQRRQSRCC